jgi:glycine dehydrogenase subunit 2
MNTRQGTSGLVLNEPLLWEKGHKGQTGFSLPRQDIPSFPIDEDLTADALNLPETSEPEIVRHFTRLSQWNFGVDTGMYPLGSCTMKYNPKINEALAALHGFAGAHPLLPPPLSQGLLRLMFELEGFLAEITGMDAVSLQPAAGAQGELTGMLILDAYHKRQGRKPTKILITDTAHGTNPASAALGGYRPITVDSNAQGILSPDTVQSVMDHDTAGLMITNPNTLGLFEKNIKIIADIIHGKGGQMYCDGANMNAAMGIVDMGRCGVDVLHLNLHKTFSTPHGGGGPGSGPICVKNHLKPFLPIPRIVMNDGEYIFSENYPESIGKLHAFYGNVGVMIRAYAYIRTMGAEYLKKASQLAVLNANYIKESLKDTFHLPYDQPCMHECVFSDQFQKPYKVTTLDMAKRMMDYGFHPPTIYFPLVVNGAMMIEPTETESKEEIDGFIYACKAIAKEAETTPDLLLQAPHNCKVKRLDEVSAARSPRLTG